MQATADGEFYPEKNLDRNYKIPRKGSGVSTPGSNMKAPNNPRIYKNSQNETPLANSYYNYPYDPRAASAYYQNFQYFHQYGHPGQGHHHRSNHNFNAPPPPPPPSDGVEPIKRNIYNTLKDIKEKPKTYDKNIYGKNNGGYGNQGYDNEANDQGYVEQTVPDLLDDSLPKDLKLLFQPLFCKLCSAPLSSNQSAKMHYKSKNHEKKIRKWLVEWSEKTGAPLPRRAIPTNAKKEEESEKNPAWFHCDVCDLELTGQMHAESHYMGRNHQKALLGHKAPAGQGYYKDGKWVRIKGQKSKSFDFERGEDSFGMDFKKAQDDDKKSDSSNSEPPAKKKKEAQPPSQFHCDVCDINTTCQEQLDNHFRGQKHTKKLKQLGLDNYAEHTKSETSGSVPVPADTTPSITEPAVNPDMNLSVYRTPSGDYYCPTCNITTNSEPQFIQHMKSKGHAKKVLQKRSKPTIYRENLFNGSPTLGNTE